MVDHGIQQDDDKSEFDSFVSIGHHLHEKGLPVPEIFLSDRFSGLVFMEDLGDMHLEDVVRKKSEKNKPPPRI